jgi:hypothetical protein
MGLASGRQFLECARPLALSFDDRALVSDPRDSRTSAAGATCWLNAEIENQAVDIEAAIGMVGIVEWL